MIQICSSDGVCEHLDVVPWVHPLDGCNLRAREPLPIEAYRSKERGKGVANQVEEIDGVGSSEGGLGGVRMGEGD